MYSVKCEITTAGYILSYGDDFSQPSFTANAADFTQDKSILLSGSVHLRKREG